MIPGGPRGLTRRELGRLLGVGAVGVAAVGTSIRRQPPNVLLVLPDQVRACSLSANGDPNVQTPHVDGLLSAGVHFTRACAANPMCSPSRATLLTGLPAHRTGVVGNRDRLGPVPTLATLLGQARYRCGYIGKWSLDGPGNAFVPFEGRGGFTHWQAYNRNHRYLSSAWFEGDDPEPREPVPADTYEPVYQAAQARAFFEEHRGRPWFLTVAFGPPYPGPAPGDRPPEVPAEDLDRFHPALLELRANVPAELAGDSTLRRYLAGYYAGLSSVDRVIGTLVGHLADLELAGNTLVVFASDHGEMGGSHGLFKTSQPYEESIGVPLSFVWPGVLPSGLVVDRPVTLADVAPTILSLAGVDPPEGMRGRDLSPWLRGRTPSGPTSDEGVLVVGKLGLPESWQLLRTRRHKYVEWVNEGRQQLFDLEEDPFELTDLHGRAGTEALARELEHGLAELRQAVDDPTPADGSG